MRKLLIIQPLLASYRKNLFEDMLNHFDDVHVFANLYPKNGFSTPIETRFIKTHTPFVGKRNKVYYQKGIISFIIKNRPTHIFLTQDFRAINFWLVIVLAKILNIPTFGHGQGLYDKPNEPLLHKIMFKSSISLLKKYICYTQSVYKTLESIGIAKNKLEVMDNTIINKFPIKEINTYRDKNKLFYLGRLRKGCNVELLLKAMFALKNIIPGISLEIIGDGEEKQDLINIVYKYKLNVTFHGAIYDDKKVSEISKKSTYGIYPGDAGLSIVHYMSLSLIPIVHNDLSKHMGPEPSYIHNGINGMTFERNSEKSLINILNTILNNTKIQKNLSANAFKSYCELNEIKMSDKLKNILLK